MEVFTGSRKLRAQRQHQIFAANSLKIKDKPITLIQLFNTSASSTRSAYTMLDHQQARTTIEEGKKSHSNLPSSLSLARTYYRIWILDWPLT